MRKNLKDVVCGMDTSTESKFHLDYEGKTYYFCSDSCRNKFHKDPHEYIHDNHKDKSCSSCKPIFDEHRHVIYSNIRWDCT